MYCKIAYHKPFIDHTLQMNDGVGGSVDCAAAAAVAAVRSGSSCGTGKDMILSWTLNSVHRREVAPPSLKRSCTLR